jgi:hypothetical protein
MQTQKKLDLIHNDICQTHTFIGYIYFLTIIGENFKYKKVYFLKHKSKVFEIIMHFKKKIETQIGKKSKKFKVLGTSLYLMWLDN